MLWILFGALLGGANGQINAPNCNSSLDYQWSFNSLDQNPCVVASFLGQACDTQYSIPSLNTTEHYGGPSTGQDNPCQCSSVMYILLSACGACQGGSFIACVVFIHCLGHLSQALTYGHLTSDENDADSRADGPPIIITAPMSILRCELLVFCPYLNFDYRVHWTIHLSARIFLRSFWSYYPQIWFN
ncbi:uncharacterized protein C8R40DRAFT_1112300 [Lentinula edodes]|uniref:uncharacterized protein n=1 Tax=Lentinula edodes TaxID=5353 RepID=UPI001E8E6BB7|nr:uncharacterized protein C8R40DRAFT_1112300 [Lentinula edodes]KAH7873515.1 hypothetical protein C8R40DRAFT_1112300 [Lentinula edodes]